MATVLLIVYFTALLIYCAVNHRMDIFAAVMVGVLIAITIIEFFVLFVFIVAIVCALALIDDEEEKKEDTK
ncbi:hypothetical protein GRG99_002394 [Salmonella enterica subsp. enterica serovar Virchow]|nr:hypothetical protein [Salmonella enterica subsp. enterica serovar Virchow]